MRSEKFPVTDVRQNASIEHEGSYSKPLQAAMNAASDGSHRAGILLNQPGQSAGVPDAALAEAAQRGEKRAFLEIVARHQAMVYGIAFSILGDFAASEDAAQEAFLTAWRKIHDLRDADRLKAWLGQIARTSAQRYQRNRRGGGPVEEWIDQTDPAPQPDEAAASEEEAVLVREALAKLPESFRLPLILYYCDGQSVKRVAETLELSEDAVKQRLARGRGMLRDRMSGLIETVLTRAQPTAVFTMAVAAAIGALASPAMVAGAAFTTAAGATGTTSTTASSAVTAMSTAKTSLTIAAIVAAACLPLGYGARISMESAAAAPPLNGSAGRAGPQTSGPDFPRNSLFDEWRKLHARLGSTADAMPLLYDAIADLKDPVRQRIFHTAQIAEWAEVAPETGLAFFLERASQIGRNANRIHYGELTQFFNEWMLRDADAAVKSLVVSGGNWKTLALLSLQEVAKRVPGRLADIASQLPNSNNARDERVRDAFAIMAEGSLESARIAAEGTTGFYREQALAGVAKAWGKTDMEGAIAWAKSLPDDVNHDAIIRGALMGAAAVKPETALDKVKSIAPGGQKFSRNSTGSLVLEEAAKAGYDATVAWLTKHPAELGAEETLGMNSAVRDRLHADAAGFLNRHAADGSLSVLMPSILSVVSNQAGQHAAIWEWLKTQTDSVAVTQLRQRIITTTGYQQPELALKMVTDFPATKEGDAWVERIASCLLTDGYTLNRFDDLMAKAPERLRQPLLKAAFDSLNGARLMNSGIDDPQKWLARVSLAPEPRRADLTSNVAAAWAAQAPEEAVAWTVALPEGATRSSALGAVAGAWIAKDAYGASEWITTLPAGPDKDRAADALVKAIATDSPEEAWQWTLSIADPALRANSVLQSLTAMQKRDPVTARQWLESAPVSQQEREQFRTTLNANSAKPK